MVQQREAAMKVVVEIDGMTCGACESTVRGCLLRLPEVRSVELVDFRTNRAVMTCKGDTSGIVESLSCVGFDARVLEEYPLQEEESLLVQTSKEAEGVDASKPDLEAGLALAPSEKNLSSQCIESVIASATFSVGGMSCAACVSSIERTAMKVPGVRSACASLPMGQLEVFYDAASTGTHEIAGAVRRAGYTAQHIPSVGDAEENMDEQQRRQGAARKKELRSAGLRLFFALLFAIPLVTISSTAGDSMGINFKSADTDTDTNNATGVWYNDIVPGLDVISFVQFCLATPVQFGSGAIFYKSAWKDVRNRSLTMNFLVCIGTSAAYFYSVMMMILGLKNGSPNSKQLFFETSASLISFILIGKLLELLARKRAGNAVTRLMALRPLSAIIMHEWPSTVSEQTIPAKQLAAGDVVKIVRGAKVPADGVIIQGNGAFNESMLTGESMPTAKSEGSSVIGGTICEEGLCYCRITKIGAQSALNQIVAMVQKAQASKPPIQELGDQASAIFVPTVLIISLLTFITWMILTSSGAIPESWYRDLPGQPTAVLFSFMTAVSVLVIACPCAVGMASPMAIVVGMGVGAHNGVLIKGGAAIQKAATMKVVVFDKTGTLTFGKPQVTDCLILLSSKAGQSMTHKSVVAAVASAEKGSEHPLARAIVTYADECQLSKDYQPIEDGSFIAVSGRGLSCKVANADIAVGSPSYISAYVAAYIANNMNENVSTEENEQHSTNTNTSTVTNLVTTGRSVADLVEGLERRGQTVVCAAINGIVVAIFGICDSIRPEASQVVAALQRRNVEVWMVTGDNRLVAHAVAQQIGIKKECVMAQVLPGDKADKIGELQKNGTVAVSMVGDGINDAPALARADLGIAIVSGTDVALDSADVVLMRGKLQDVITTLSLSASILRRIKINFAWALGYNCLGIPMAAGVFFPLVHKTLPPALAGAAMALSSVSVVLSSLCLRLYKTPSSVRNIDKKTMASAPAVRERILTDEGFSLTANLTHPIAAVAIVDMECSCRCCDSLYVQPHTTSTQTLLTSTRKSSSSLSTLKRQLSSLRRSKSALITDSSLNSEEVHVAEAREIDTGICKAGGVNCCGNREILALHTEVRPVSDELLPVTHSTNTDTTSACSCRCSRCKCKKNEGAHFF